MIKRIFNEEKGSVVVLVALAMVALIGFAALAIDGGYLYYRHTRFQDVADAVALAAAHELVETKDYKKAFKVAVDYAENNQIKIDSSDSSSYTAKITYAGNEHGEMTVNFPDGFNEVKVDISINAKMYLATVLGIKPSPVAVSATARAGQAAEQTGNLIPVAFFYDDYKSYDTYKTYDLTLAPNGGGGQSGNYGFLDYASSSDFKTYLEHGYDGTLSVYEDVPTYPGVTAGQVDEAINYRINWCKNNHDPECSVSAENPYTKTVQPDCPRLVVVPIVDVNDFFTSNGKSYITITGFATFFIENYDKNNKILSGYFLDTVNASKVTGGDSNFMMKAVTLVK